MKITLTFRGKVWTKEIQGEGINEVNSSIERLIITVAKMSDGEFVPSAPIVHMRVGKFSDSDYPLHKSSEKEKEAFFMVAGPKPEYASATETQEDHG